MSQSSPASSAQYWIVRASSTVRQLISSCVIGRRIKAPPQDQKMADLPKDRLTTAPPLTYVSVDYFGPFTTKQGKKEHKRYEALLTCLVSRAVHFEIANSLETDGFPNALRRFIARRRPVREIRCDNGVGCWCREGASCSDKRNEPRRDNGEASSAAD